MIKEIFLKEIREHINTNKMIIAYVIILILFITNSFFFIMGYRNDLIEYQRIFNENKELIKKNSNNLMELTFTDQKVTYPPANLGFISEAMEKNLPNGLSINFFSVSNPEYYKKTNLFFSDSQTLDWNNILIMFVSFICIFLSYNSFSGEKVEGTLKLIMSNSVNRSHILLGKYLGICFVVFLPILAGILINLIIFLLSPEIALSWNHYFCIILFLIAAWLFISLNICIGVLISTLTTKPIISLSFIILVWLFLFIVLPSVGWVIAEKSIVVESINNINDQISSENMALGGSMWSDQWKTPTPEVLANKDLFAKMTEKTNRTWNKYRVSLFNQTDYGIVLTKISPFQTFRFLSEKIADNGYFRYRNFYNQVKEFHRSFREFIVSKDKLDPDSYHLIWSMKYYSMGFMSNKPVLFKEIPTFEYKSPSFFQTFLSVKFEFFILILWNIVIFFATLYSLTKYDVR